MSPVADLAHRILRRADLEIGRGLSDDQIADIQVRFGFTLNRDHAGVLRNATPYGWTDWTGDEQDVRDSLAWPIEGVLFDVARRCLAATSQLVPISGHRYIPAAPEPSGAPWLSV